MTAHSDVGGFAESLHGQKQHLAELEAELTKLRAKDEQVCALIAESRGIEGLHLNGDIASWEELMHGVNFGSWLDTYADDFPL